MQYLLQIFSSGTSGWDRLSEDEQNAITGEYLAISATPGVVGGAQLQSGRHRDDRARRERPHPHDRRAVSGEPRGARRLLPVRGRRPRRCARARGAHSRRRGMGGAIEVRATGRALIERRLPRALGARPRCADRLPRRLRSRRGGRAGGLRARCGALAARRRRRQAPRLADRGRAQSCARPHPSRARARRRRPGCSTSLQCGEDTVDDTAFPDERLELIFTCCHPALSLDAQVALTLRTLGGLTTSEIAQAFLVEEATMAQRLVRAKRKIQLAGHPVPRSRRRAACPSGSRPCSRSST